MQHTHFVRGFQPGAELQHQSNSTLHRKLAFTLKNASQAFAFDVGHRDVLQTGARLVDDQIVDPHDIAMADLTRQEKLVFHSFNGFFIPREIRPQQLQGNVNIQFHVTCPINHAHPASPNQFYDSVAGTQDLPWRQIHRIKTGF